MGGFREVPVLLLICFHSWPAQKPEPGLHGVPDAASDLRVSVRVYNGVNLSSGDLSRAEREAERIRLYAGIHLTWTAGLRGADVNDGSPSEEWNPASLQLRIWPRAMAGKRPTSSETLGFCLSFENGDAVVLATPSRSARFLDPQISASALMHVMLTKRGPDTFETAARPSICSPRNPLIWWC
jgi:hypothetical protein